LAFRRQVTYRSLQPIMREAPSGVGIHIGMTPTMTQAHPPPQAAGLYYVRNEESDVQYIGVGNELPDRFDQHRRRSGKIQPGEFFDYWIAREDATLEDLFEKEREKIDKYHPPRNKRRGGGGRRAR
jgi:hypothetical protein